MSEGKIVKGEVVDITELVDQAMGSEMFIKEMIGIFIRTIPEEIVKLNEAVEATDYAAIYAISHKIKPNYHFIGLKQPQDLLLEMELMAKEEKGIEEIKEKYKTVADVTASAIAELGTILQSY